MFSCIIQLSIAFDLKRTLMARPNFDVERNWFREWFFVRSFPALGLFGLGVDQGRVVFYRGIQRAFFISER